MGGRGGGGGGGGGGENIICTRVKMLTNIDHP